jgi:hypothetical protein
MEKDNGYYLCDRGGSDIYLYLSKPINIDTELYNNVITEASPFLDELKLTSDYYNKDDPNIVENYCESVREIQKLTLHEFTCDKCDGYIAHMDLRYYNNVTNQDFCNNCINERSKHKLISIKDDLGFGSFYDWTGIVSDVDGNLIICNINRDSPYYKNFGCIVIDNHGRMGFFNFGSDCGGIVKLLDELRELDEKYINNYDSDNDDNKYDCEYSHYNDDKIQNLAIARGFSTYYG